MEAVRRWTSLCARLADASGASVRDEIPKVYSLVTNPFALVPQVCQSSCSGLEALVTNPAAAGRSLRHSPGRGRQQSRCPGEIYRDNWHLECLALLGAAVGGQREDPQIPLFRVPGQVVLMQSLHPAF